MVVKKIIAFIGFFAAFFVCACSDKKASLPLINDTGITWGGNYPKGINQDCSASINSEDLLEGDIINGDILAFQDCTNGRDAKHQNQNDQKNKPGFVYRKVDYQGEFLEVESDFWFCVVDEISGLMWENKLPSDGVAGNQGLHDSDDLFTWYSSSPSNNGGAIGDWNSNGNNCTGYVPGQPTTYCNIEEFLNRVNQQGLCGYRDWRIPSRPELESLVHFGRTVPAIEVHYFPNTQNQFYWSRSPTVAHTSTAWSVNFQFGYSAPVQRTNPRPVRLVRGGKRS